MISKARLLFFSLFFSVVFAVHFLARSQDPSPNLSGILKEDVADLKKTHDGGTLREQIIKVLLESEETSQQTDGGLIWKLSVLATSGLAFMWLAFWFFVWLREENVTDILLSPSFFKTVCVMGVIAATVVLSLSGRLEANLTGAILSGVVGYVLGTITGRRKHENEGEDRPSRPTPVSD
jgi:hypothetical protein